jgi:hypothetical protein
MLRVFPTTSKGPSLEILAYLFSMLQRDGINVLCVQGDKDGALANSTEITSSYLLILSI